MRFCKRTIWALEHRWQGVLYNWRFEQSHADPNEITVISWEVGNIIKTRQCAIHTRETARKLWDLIVLQGAIIDKEYPQGISDVVETT